MCKGLSQLPATCLKGAKDIKHKISHLLQKPELQATESKSSKEKTNPNVKTAGSKRAPTAAEVEQWRQSLSHLVKSDVGRAVFSTFLQSEFSEENLKFWEACEEYRRSPPSQLQSRAKQIYQRFIQADAPNEVNLDAATRDLTQQNLEEACPTCFDEAQRLIFILMEKDSYRRFIRSPVLMELCPTTVHQQGGDAERAGGA